MSESNNSTGIISFTEEGFSFSRHGFDAVFFFPRTPKLTDRLLKEQTPQTISCCSLLTTSDQKLVVSVSRYKMLFPKKTRRFMMRKRLHEIQKRKKTMWTFSTCLLLTASVSRKHLLFCDNDVNNKTCCPYKKQHNDEILMIHEEKIRFKTFTT